MRSRNKACRVTKIKGTETAWAEFRDRVVSALRMAKREFFF